MGPKRTTAAQVSAPRQKAAGRMPENELYRAGYPGQRDDPSAAENLRFFRGERPSAPDGDFITDIHEKWKGNYELLERHHGYVQWLFPIREMGMNMLSQPLQIHEARAIAEDVSLQRRAMRSFALMLDFYGFELVDERLPAEGGTGALRRAAHHAPRFSNLLRNGHNNLRITRILKFLGEVGLETVKYFFVYQLLLEVFCTKALRALESPLTKFWLETVKCDLVRSELTKFATALRKSAYIKASATAGGGRSPAAPKCVAEALAFLSHAPERTPGEVPSCDLQLGTGALADKSTWIFFLEPSSLAGPIRLLPPRSSTEFTTAEGCVTTKAQLRQMLAVEGAREAANEDEFAQCFASLVDCAVARDGDAKRARRELGDARAAQTMVQAAPPPPAAATTTTSSSFTPKEQRAGSEQLSHVRGVIVAASGALGRERAAALSADALAAVKLQCGASAARAVEAQRALVVVEASWLTSVFRSKRIPSFSDFPL